MGKSTESKPTMFQLWVTKQVTGFCATKKMMKRWGKWDNYRYPCCNSKLTTEDKLHAQDCQAQTAREARAERLQELEKWLK